MNTGRIIGLVVFIILGGLSYYLISVTLEYGLSDIFLVFGIIAYTVGAAIATYSMTLEGSIYLARRFGASNEGIAPVIEKGKFLNMIRINYSEDSFRAGENTYKIDEEKTYFRKRLNIPYTFFRHNKFEPLSLYDEKEGIAPQVVTGYIMSRLAVLKSLAFDKQFLIFLVAIIAVGALVIIGTMVTIYFISQNLDTTNAIKAGVDALRATPTPPPSSGGIPNA